MKCKTCGEEMEENLHGEDDLMGWFCEQCYLAQKTPQEKADNHDRWFRCAKQLPA